MNINLHIERLILEDAGFDRLQASSIKAAVESELKRQLLSHGINPMKLSHNHHSRTTIDNSHSIDKTPMPTRFGQQIGNAIYRGISK